MTRKSSLVTLLSSCCTILLRGYPKIGRKKPELRQSEANKTCIKREAKLVLRVINLHCIQLQQSMSELKQHDNDEEEIDVNVNQLSSQSL